MMSTFLTQEGETELCLSVPTQCLSLLNTNKLKLQHRLSIIFLFVEGSYYYYYYYCSSSSSSTIPISWRKKLRLRKGKCITPTALLWWSHMFYMQQSSPQLLSYIRSIEAIHNIHPSRSHSKYDGNSSESDWSGDSEVHLDRSLVLP